MAVPALARQMVIRAGIGAARAGEGDAVVDQPLDTPARVFDGILDHGGIAQAGAGAEGILDVGLQRILLVEHDRDPSLGVQRGALAQRRLGEQGDAGRRCEPQGQAEPGGAAADDQDIEGGCRTHAGARNAMIYIWLFD